MSAQPRQFDSAYYRRHYLQPRTAVTSRLEMRRRAEFIGSFICHLDLPVRSILDAGCGLGWLRRPLLRHLPRARYTGLEASAYLCRRYGWLEGSLAKFAPSRPFDLVICYDVLQYVPDSEAPRAMANLARLTRGALYFSALTSEDWRSNCDQQRTDARVSLRSAAWYRKRLARGFRHLGGGIYLRRGASVHQWELEKIE